jgi:hypothetical protein
LRRYHHRRDLPPALADRVVSTSEKGRLVCIESVTHWTDPARETVRFEMNDLVELGPDQPPTERDLLPALGMCQTPKDR